jgi:hypothetical protein
MLPTIVRRTAQENIPYAFRNPYKAKRLWPPDFEKLSPKQQFRLERTYKRRAKLKWARPRWTKGVKIVQLTTILCGYIYDVMRNRADVVVVVGVYGVLFMDWNLQTSDRGQQPFQGVY